MFINKKIFFDRYYHNEPNFLDRQVWANYRPKSECCSDLGLHCLPFHLHLLDTLFCGKTTLFKFYDNYSNLYGCRIVWVFMYSKNIWAATWQNQQNDVCPAKTQISLGIRPVWSEPSLSARRNLGSLAIHWAHSKDWSDWADLSLRWAHMSLCWFCRVVAHFVMQGKL